MSDLKLLIIQVKKLRAKIGKQEAALREIKSHIDSLHWVPIPDHGGIDEDGDILGKISEIVDKALKGD